MPKRKAVSKQLEFHDVIFFIQDVLPGSVISDDRQTITARVVMKYKPAEAKKMYDLLGDYLKDYKDGAGPVLITGIGKFSR